MFFGEFGFKLALGLFGGASVDVAAGDELLEDGGVAVVEELEHGGFFEGLDGAADAREHFVDVEGALGGGKLGMGGESAWHGSTPFLPNPARFVLRMTDRSVRPTVR